MIDFKCRLAFKIMVSYNWSEMKIIFLTKASIVLGGKFKEI